MLLVFNKESPMKLQLIRNATVVLDYGGQRILIDPYFAPKHTRPSFIASANKPPPLTNPLVDLPIPPAHILEGVALVIISHLHSDHFDSVAQEMVPKDLPVLCQPEEDQAITGKGFGHVTAVETHHEWRGIGITRIAGHHGSGEVEGIMGKVSGFIFQAAGEPTLYWAGDTVLCEEVRQVVLTLQPHVIVTHSCGATWPDQKGQQQLIVMDAAQTIALCALAPASTVIATHMDSLDHATITRHELRRVALQAQIPTHQLLIPQDGERLSL
jgi:L-ascorbate metabolism protein UlaG (beta-lactamase superfamily)